jgi:hypothetical protein
MSNFCLKPQLISIIIIQEYCLLGHCQKSYHWHDLIRNFCDMDHKVPFLPS